MHIVTSPFFFFFLSSMSVTRRRRWHANAGVDIRLPFFRSRYRKNCVGFDCVFVWVFLKREKRVVGMGKEFLVSFFCWNFLLKFSALLLQIFCYRKTSNRPPPLVEPLGLYQRFVIFLKSFGDTILILKISCGCVFPNSKRQLNSA
jgi:hypothetical protein